MAVTVGNAAVAGASSSTVSRTGRLAFQKNSTFSSKESFVRVSLRGAPSPSSSGRLSLRTSTRPNFRIGAASRNGAARELVTENEVSDLSQATINGVQFLELEKESFTSADSASELVAEFEELLEEKAQEVGKLNHETTIFLVGMMASGKSTVGRLVAKALDYEFFDSDEVIESYVGGLPVKDIFRQKSEAGFRELETRALRELADSKRLVVATGGGAVVRRHNWAYLQDGITVWLDVPVEDLARRVTAVGTESRPLLGGACCAFEQAFARLSKLLDERGPHYAMADCRLSFQDLASSLQLKEVAQLTPTAIAVQVLEEIRQLLQCRKYMRAPLGY